MSNDRKLTTRASSTSKQKVTKTEKSPRQSKVIDNCNDEKYPHGFSGIIEICYYYLSDKLRLLWRGNEIAIEYTSKADLDYYCQMLHWDIDTAIALSMGQSPRKIHMFWHRFSPEFKQEYEQRKVLFREAVRSRDLAHEIAKSKSYIFFSNIHAIVRPLNFVIWTKKRNWELFFDIEELVKKRSKEQNVDFEHRCKELEHEIRLLKQEMYSKMKMDENPLCARREKSYQKLIAGLLKLRYKNSLDLINASNVASILAGVDLPFMISEDTIRTLLEPCKRLPDIYSKSDKDKIE